MIKIQDLASFALEVAQYVTRMALASHLAQMSHVLPAWQHLLIALNAPKIRY